MGLRLPDHWVWDTWYAVDGATVHAFFLQAPRSIGDPEARHTPRPDRPRRVARPALLGGGPVPARARAARVLGRAGDLDRQRDPGRSRLADGVLRHRGRHGDRGPADRVRTVDGPVHLDPWRPGPRGRSPLVRGRSGHGGFAVARPVGMAGRGRPAAPVHHGAGQPRPGRRARGHRSRVERRRRGLVRGRAAGVRARRAAPARGPAAGRGGARAVGDARLLPGDRPRRGCVSRGRVRWRRPGPLALEGPSPLGPFTVPPGPFLDGDPEDRRYAGQDRGARRASAGSSPGWTGAPDGSFAGELADPVPVETDGDGRLRLVRGAPAPG